MDLGTAAGRTCDVTQFFVERAAKNWQSWQNVYEHQGPARDNPLLADVETFGKFLKRYSVNRTIRSGSSDRLRELLRCSQFPLTAILEDASGRMLDVQEAELRPDFGTLDGRRGLRSALSKIAHFLAPQTFNPWDSQARKGVKLVLLPRSVQLKTYAEYLAEINSLLRGELGESIRAACSNKYPSKYAQSQDRFPRRVLDRFLMGKGGRKRPSGAFCLAAQL